MTMYGTYRKQCQLTTVQESEMAFRDKMPPISTADGFNKISKERNWGYRFTIKDNSQWHWVLVGDDDRLIMGAPKDQETIIVQFALWHLEAVEKHGE